MKNPISGFIINSGLLLFGSVMAFSGLLIQFNYHMGNHGDIDMNAVVLGISYGGWSDFHLISIILVSILMVYHFILHWKWYKTIVMKHLIAKNKQVIALTIIFILAAFTGYASWLIKLTGGEDISSKAFIEIHDKIAILLFVFLILHVVKRMKWFINSFRKI